MHRRSRRAWSRIRTAKRCDPRTYSPWPRARCKKRKAALRTELRGSARASRAALPPWTRGTQPIAGIQRDAALAANFEMEVRALVARLTADVSDQLAANDAVALPDARVVQVGVERVVAPAMVDQHRGEIEAERSGEAHRARGDRPHRRADGRLDADAVPRNTGVIGARRGPKGIDDGAFDRPVETAEIGGRDCPRSGGDAAQLGLAPRALPCFDPVVERSLIAIQARQPLLRLARAASRRAQVGFAFALEREIAAELVGPLLPATAERLARIHEQLPLPRNAGEELVHGVVD